MFFFHKIMEPKTIDGLVYLTLTEEDADEAIQVADEAMKGREPVLSAIGLDMGEASLFSYMKPRLVSEGISTIAKDEKTGKVVGCRFTCDFVDTPGPPVFPPGVEE